MGRVRGYGRCGSHLREGRSHTLAGVHWAWAIIPLFVTLAICGCQASGDSVDAGDAGNEEQSAEATSTSGGGDYSPQFSYESDSELNEKTKKKFEQYLDQIHDEKFNYESAGSGGRSIEIDEAFDSAQIFSSEGLDQMLDYSREDITYDDIRDDIDKLDMPDKCKEIYKTLAENLERQYPDMDLRIWDINLQTMKYEEVGANIIEAMGIHSAIYLIGGNKIQIQEGFDYQPGTLEYQILVHEFCHPIRAASFDVGETSCFCEFDGLGEDYDSIDEAMNSILALRSYDPDDALIGYTVISHMIEVILECMDNYTLQDYVEHDVYYFASKLDEMNGDGNAIEMLNLMQLCWEDIKDDEVTFPVEYYYGLYDYIARMYYDKYLSSDMSADQVQSVEDELIGKLGAELTGERAQQLENAHAHFDDYLAEYCKSHGISFAPEN